MRQMLISVLFATFGYALAVQAVFDKMVEGYTAAPEVRAELFQTARA